MKQNFRPQSLLIIQELQKHCNIKHISGTFSLATFTHIEPIRLLQDMVWLRERGLSQFDPVVKMHILMAWLLRLWKRALVWVLQPPNIYLLQHFWNKMEKDVCISAKSISWSCVKHLK